MNAEFYPATVTAKDVMLCWNAGTDQVALVRWPDKADNSHQYRSSDLACYTHIRNMSFEQRKTQIFVSAMHLIARDGCDPNAVHRALSGLKEYCAGCAPDMPVLAKGVELPLGNLYPEMEFSDEGASR